MKDFTGKIAVITGGGAGMGRELARALVAEGCHVAICDVSQKSMAETVRLCHADGAPQGTRLTTHIADVSDEVQVRRFRAEVAQEMDTEKIHLLFNNAGIGGGGSFVKGERDEWEKTFNISWGGVYFNTRAFLPMLLAADEGHIVNTSSVNGFWASLGPHRAHTAYSAAKFAVKGFTEALVNDLRLNAPHIKCSVVMPGHIGTAIVANSRKVLSGDHSDKLSPQQAALARERIAGIGTDGSALADDAIEAMVLEQSRRVEEEAPTTAAQAARIILDGVKAERWRILVGADAQTMDRLVRNEPEAAYEQDFFDRMVSETGWRLGR